MGADCFVESWFTAVGNCIYASVTDLNSYIRLISTTAVTRGNRRCSANELRVRAGRWAVNVGVEGAPLPLDLGIGSISRLRSRKAILVHRPDPTARSN